MDTWTAPSKLELDLIGAVGDRPNRWVRANTAGVLGCSRTPNETVFQAMSGRKTVTRFGRDSIDATLTCSAIDRATMQALEEFRHAGTPVYVYPSMPATLQGFWPLRNGLAGDPADLSYTGSLANTDTTMYVVEADTRTGYYFRSVDPTTVQIRRGLLTGAGQSSEFAMGRGAYLWKSWKNHVQNSLFGAISSYMPANWTQSGGTAGTDVGVKTSSLFGIPVLWTWGTGVTLTSAWFAVNAGTICALSYAAFTDGSMTVTVDFDGGTDFTKTTGPGAVYVQEDIDVPALATKARIIVTTSAGTWTEFGAPQVLGGLTGFDNSFTPYFLGSSGSATTGEVNASVLTLSSQDFGPMGGTNLCLAVTGYYLPVIGADTEGPTNGLCCLQNTVQSKSTSLEWSDFSTGLKLHVRQDDVIKASSDTTLPGAGMTYAWGLFVGWTGTNTYHIYGALAQVNDAPAITASCDIATGVDPLTRFDKLSVGKTYAANTQADGIVGGVSIATIPYASRETWMRHMAHRNFTDLWRNHFGRQYRVLLNDMSPLPWNRQVWRGTVQLEQLREL